MQNKLFKIFGVIGGLIVIWFGIFFIFGNQKAESTTTLEFWSVFDDSENIEPLLDEFTAATGIKVNYRNFTDLDDYRDTLLIELAAGEGPDIFAVHNSWIPKYQNFLRPLPAELGYSVDDVKKDFVDAVGDTLIRENSDEENDGELLGLPMYVDSLALFYNKYYFRNVLAKSYSAPELTWSGVREDSMGLTQISSNSETGFRLAGIALGRADNISRGVDIFYNLYFQNGGGNLTADGDISSKKIQSALEFLTAFSRNSKNQEYSWNAKMDSEISAFAEGRVAMIFGFSYYFDKIKNAISGNGDAISADDIGVAEFPQIGDPLAGDPKVALADFFALAVAKSSKFPAESWRLILDLTSRDSEQKYFDATKKPTSRRDLIDSQKDSPVGVFVAQSIFADTLEMVDDEIFDAAVADTLDRISDGQISPADGASELSSVFQNTISKSEK